ncbi:uncharacterized protein LOC102614193 isoform X3 [Citrus sinensis]|uniref:uncharacterized protein LOC102614193 isoform X3 n=1 Tax=Citrus sinensis TaxID=2711 RepID=UPI002279D397|nr:uncharacterized protein LOC102614193 isoform X3 [Citrus sinensis]
MTPYLFIHVIFMSDDQVCQILPALEISLPASGFWGMSIDPSAPMNYVEEDATSGSGDDGNILDGHNKRQPVTPSSSGRRKRNRKAAGDAIVEAMLEIAAASKMRAAAITKNEERFSISKCIKVLDDMQDLSGSMDDYDLELDQMELVAAAAGFYYYNSIVKQPQRGISPSGSGFMTQVLEGHDDICRQMFRMDKHVFHKLSDTLRQRGMLRDTSGVIIEEQLAIFLNIVGHNERNRVIQERFQHSGETISRHFNNVLKAIKSLSREFLQPPPQTTPPEILCSHRFYPYFKDCIGVIDGMHIPAHVPAKEQSQFRNKKDSRVLRAVLDDPDQNFPHIPEGNYYLVDMDYTNTEGFIAPYVGIRYHLHEYRGANKLPRNAKELFNHRHSSLRNVIQRSFNVLKTRFPILKLAPQYAFHIQRDIVIAACVLHNYIRREEKNDWLFATVNGEPEEEMPYFEDQFDMQLASSMQEQIASAMRESIAAAMWNDFINKLDQW